MDVYSQPTKGIKYIFQKIWHRYFSRTKGPLVLEPTEVRSEKSFDFHLSVFPTKTLSELPSHDKMMTSSSPNELVPTVSILNKGMNEIMKSLLATKAYYKRSLVGAKITRRRHSNCDFKVTPSNGLRDGY